MIAWKAFATGVRALAFSPDGTRLAAASPVAGVKVFDAVSGRELWEFGEANFAPQVAFTPDGRRVVTLVGQRVAVLDAADGRLVAKHSRSLAAFAVPPDPGDLLVTTAGMDTAEFRRVGLTDGAVREKKVLQYHGGIERMEISPDAGTVGTVGHGEALLLDVATRKVRLAEPLKAGYRRPPGLAFAPDGRTVVFTNISTVLVCDVASAAVVRTVPTGMGMLRSVAYRRDGRALFTVCGTSRVEEWDTHAWTRTKSFAWAAGPLSCVATSPDGTLAAAGSDSGKVVVWDVDA